MCVRPVARFAHMAHMLFGDSGGVQQLAELTNVSSTNRVQPYDVHVRRSYRAARAVAEQTFVLTLCVGLFAPPSWLQATLVCLWVLPYGLSVKCHRSKLTAGEPGTDPYCVATACAEQPGERG